MTTLFLYGLGFCCLSVIALLIWDAYAAKRHQREWAEDWKTPGSSLSNDAGVSGGVLLKRPRILKPAFWITVAATIVTVAVAKRHSTVTHQLRVANDSATSQSKEVGTTSSDRWNLLADGESEDSWSFTGAVEESHPAFSKASISKDGSAWPEAFAWVATGGLTSNDDADFDSWATISLNLWLSSEENGNDVTQPGADTGINCDVGLNSATPLNYSLNGTLLSDSSFTKQFKLSY